MSAASFLRPLRRPLGFGFIGLAGVLSIALVVAPFLELSWGALAGAMGVLFVAGEVCFFVGVLLLGKDVVKWLKDLVAKLKES
jgi:hypothetical protein